MRAKIISASILSVLVIGIGYLMWTTPSIFSSYIDSPSQGSLARLLFLEFIGGVCFLAALSLLYDVVFPRVIRFRHGSLTAFISAGWLIHPEKEAKAHVCELFVMRSFFYALVTVFLIGVPATLYAVGESLIQFLRNPYLSEINWEELGEAGWGLAAVTPFFAAGLAGYWFCSRKWKVSPRPLVYKAILSFWIYVLASIAFATMFYAMSIPAEEEHLPFLLEVLLSAGMFGGLAAAVGLAFGLYWLARRGIAMLSKKFPFLAEAWEQICPTIHFEVLKK
jgi:hypothetical protein